MALLSVSLLDSNASGFVSETFARIYSHDVNSNNFSAYRDTSKMNAIKYCVYDELPCDNEWPVPALSESTSPASEKCGENKLEKINEYLSCRVQSTKTEIELDGRGLMSHIKR